MAAAAQGDPYSRLLERLQLPHPLVQRFAVSAIFERLKSGPSHTGLQSPAGQEALARCLASPQAAVIDQTVKEVCNACAEGAVPVERGLQELQAALDAVNSASVGSVMNGIGFLCRIFLQHVREGTTFMTRSGDLLGVGFHPLVKLNVVLFQSSQSRTEDYQHILQQVGIMLVRTPLNQQPVTMEFLQPFITFILLQPLTAPNYALFARDLHSQLSLLSCQAHGDLLLKMLIKYVQLYQTETAQGRRFAMAAITELVDVWESIAKQNGLHPIKAQELEELGSQLLCTLIGLCHELLSCKVSLYHALVLVKRLMKSLRLLNPEVSDSIGVNMVSIAHILAMVDQEQEQLLLLDLGVGWLEDICGTVKQLGSGPITTSPVLLMWVFPALHVMSYPSVAVKTAAMRLLQALERAVGLTLTLENKVGAVSVNLIGSEMGTWGQQHLSVLLCRLLHSMLSEEESAVNWVSGLTAGTIRKRTSGEHWLRSLTSYLNKYSQRPRMGNSTPPSVGLSKGLLVSLCTLVTVCLLSPSVNIALAATEAFASIGKVEPIWGMSLLPVVLFCVRFQGRCEGLGASEVQLGLLEVFPSLACHSATLPLVLQALQPMLDLKCDVVVQATAIRLVCKTWEISDRAFPHLQKLLRPGDIVSEVPGQTELPQSRAACVRDVSKKDPDRGVDLVLSVQACIESRDPVVVSLGLQSLAFLCKEDLIDFYTAWLVISKLFPLLPSEPIMLQSLCMLLRYGALDAAAHPEAAKAVLEILWKAATMRGTMQEDNVYSKARAMAFEGLSFYEVDDLQNLCPDEQGKEVELLLSETSGVVLQFLEQLLIKALAHEHRERQRGQKQVKVTVSKLGKLLKAFPGALNATGFAPVSGKVVTFISDFPGAVLLCFSLAAPEKTERVSKMEFKKVVKIWQANHEKIFLEAADQLHFGSNLVAAMLSLQSWCSFVSRWLHTMFTIYEADSPNIGHDENLLKAAKHLSKIIKKSCEDSIPRVAESATLALAALCKVMPTQAHGISEEISEYLELRLLQGGHEHMQWSATLSLGVVSASLHATDWNRKHAIVQLLLKHAGTSDRGIVRGACGLALGIVSQSLLRQEGGSQSSGAGRQRETELLVQITLSLIQLTSETCPPAASALGTLLRLLRTEIIAKERLATYPLPQPGPKLEEESFWAVVGLVWGLGSSVNGLDQLQCPTLVSALTDLMISWVSVHSEQHSGSTEGSKEVGVAEFFLAAGACLVLSTCVEVAARLELLTEGVNGLLQNLISLIACATNQSISAGMDLWRSSLFCALYVGSGNLLAAILEDGAQSVKVELIKTLLGCMEAGAEKSGQGGWGQLGAMIGIANAFGAGAALLVPIKRSHQEIPELQMLSGLQVGGSEKSIISRPLLDEPACEEYVSAVIKKLLGVVRNEQGSHSSRHAGWALAFLHNGYFGYSELEGKQDTSLSDVSSSGQARQSGYHMRGLQDFPDESPLRLLCTKLVNQEGKDMVASVLRCLEKAPRLPALDWGGLIRRTLRQNQPSSADRREEARESKLSAGQMEVRKQCVLFAVAHAEQIPALAIFLDELSELSRLGTLEPSLRNLLMCHVGHLRQIFSPLRLKQLLRDVQEFAVNPTGLTGFLAEDKQEVESQRRSFRVSLWNGLASFFKDTNFRQQEDADEVIPCVEECMMALINLLSTSIWTDSASQARAEDDSSQIAEEWSAAITALAKTQKTWLLQAFEVQLSELPETQEKFGSTSRAVFARCQFLVSGCLPSTELKICHRWLVSQKLSDVSVLLVEVAWAMKEAQLVDRREWLLDSLDTAIISPFPTTAIVLAALLASCSCMMAPLLPLNPVCAIQDFPLTLPTLLSQDGWDSSVDMVTPKLTVLLNRLEDSSSKQDTQLWEPIHFLNAEVSVFGLSVVLRRTCIGLKQYLPLEARFDLGNLNLLGIRGSSP